MATDAEAKKKAELEKWLVKINPGIAKYMRASEAEWEAREKSDPKNKDVKAAAEKNLDALLGLAKVEAGMEALAKENAARQKQQDAKAAKELLDWTKKSGSSQKALGVLMSGLQQLGDDAFLKSSNAFQKLDPSGEPFVDKLLQQVDDVFNLWKNTDKLPEALALWRKTAPLLEAVLKEGEKHFDSPGFDLSRAAMSRIGKYLGIRLAFKEESDEAQNSKTPDISEALDLAQLKKMEPAMLEWQKLLNKQVSRLRIEAGKVDNLAKAIDIYFSVDDLSKKLEAFQKANLQVKIRTVADIIAYVGDQTREVAAIYTEAAKELAEKLGKKEAVEVLEKRLSALRKVAGVLAVYELGKSVGELVNAIEKGDWHQIASASFGVVSSGIGVAEAFGVVSSGTAAGATGIAFLVWAEADTIMGVAELVHWAKLNRALQAVKRMAADTKQIVVVGKKMTAATELMLQTDSASPDAVESAKYDIHNKHAIQLAGTVSKAITALGVNHVFRTNDLDSVGGYPELFLALGKPTRDALLGAYLEDPMSVSERFHTILVGIKAMVNEGNRLYGSAD
jgi:hypothetical protein